MNWLRRFFAAEGGSIMVLAALSLTMLMGMSGLAVEAGNGYSAKVSNQRVADMAALGAALAYKNAPSSTATQVATQVAVDIVVANGLPSGAATVTLPVTIGSNTAVQVQIRTTVPIKMASLITNAASYDVVSSAAATINTPTATGCIVALGTSGNTVSATGGASITASGCAINTNGTAYSSNGSAKITAKQITAAAVSDAAASYNQNAITTNPTSNNIIVKPNTASDGLAGNGKVKQALCYVNKLTGLSDPDYGDGNTNCTNQLVTPTVPIASGSTNDIVFSSNTTLPTGNYTYRNVTVNGGVTVTVGDGDFRADNVTMNGSGMTFGNGKVIVSGTFNVANGTTTTLGNGEHYFGQLIVSGGRNLVVGSGNFTVNGAITESGGSYIKVGIAAGDAVTINGGVTIGGGSFTCFTPNCSAPTAQGGTFSVNGTIATSGGSTLIFPIAATHVINGDLSLNGNSTLGSGFYIIKGNFTNNTGGTMTGAAVTFALGGTFTLSGGTSLDLAAPDSTSPYGITDILVVTKSTANTSIGGGSQDKYSGMFYAPKSALSTSGGSSISTNGSGCLMVMVSSIAASGSGTLNTSACSSQTSSTNGTVKLIQ